MTTTLLFLAVFLVGITSFGQVVPSGAAINNPNHLEPINPFDSDGYNRAVFDILIGQKETNLWMISKPSFEPEFAVIIPEAEEVKAPKPGDEADSKKIWHLEVATATQQIWHWKEPFSIPGTLDLRRNVKVNRKRIEIESSAAKAISAAWTAVVKETRYAKEQYEGNDGTTYLFYGGGYFGETWAPMKGLPAALVDLSARLKKCVESAPEDRKRLLEEAVEKAKRISLQAATAAEKNGAANDGCD